MTPAPLAARCGQEFKGGAEFDVRLCANCVHARVTDDAAGVVCDARQAAGLAPVPVRGWDYCGQFRLPDAPYGLRPQITSTRAGGYLGAFPPLPASHKP